MSKYLRSLISLAMCGSAATYSAPSHVPQAVSLPSHTLQAIVTAASVSQGVAAHLGVTDAQLECDLAASGSLLVHGLTLDLQAVPQARLTVAQQGLLGLVTIESADSFDSLPYPENLLNLLVADLDALAAKAPAQKEILRVLVPGGVAYLRQAGQWWKTVKPWPPGLDDWTHWCHGPDGNAISQDTFVAPSASLKWIAGVQGQDLRIARGQLVSPLRTVQKGQAESVDLIGRDAFNGVPSWRARTGLTAGDHPHEWVTADGLVFHFPRRNACYARATDARTGALVREFTNGLQRPLPQAVTRINGRPGVAVLLVCGKTLIQGYGRQVVALDIGSGEQRWRVELQKELAAMVAAPDGRRVFVHEVEDWTRSWARWGKHQTVAITGLLDGKSAWRNTELAGEEISDLIYHEGMLYAFDPTTNLGDDGDADFFKFAADTGAILWRKKGPKHDYNVFLNNAVVRGTNIISWGSFNNLRSYAVADGAERNHTINGYNQRCTRLSATRDWLVFGLTTWVDRDFNWTQMAVGRSDCAYPAFLAHGQTYFTYNLACSCINPLRGIVALVPEVKESPLPDSRRLQTYNTRGDRHAPAPFLPGTNRSLLASAATNIVAEWQPDALLFYFLEKTTPPVEHAGLTMVADIHRHTLVASHEGKEVWRFIAGGRIYGPPLIKGRRCYVASADGWVYCLDTATGAPHWRFLAAPRERNVVAYGQLESVWPVYNVVLHEDLVCVAAGRHAELDGGLWLWGLDPATGAVKWKTTLHTPPAKYPAGTKSPRDDLSLKREVSSVTPLNGGLASEEGRLVLLSPILKKSGSSNSKWGYFENPPDQGRGALQARRIEIHPKDWNGKKINPQDVVVLAAKRK